MASDELAAEAPEVEEPGVLDTPPPAGTPAWRRWLSRVVLTILGLAGLVVAALLVLDSAIGHRLVIDRIESLSPQSGLRIQVGRIDGSLFGEAVLHDIVLRDPEGVFLTVPRAELDWRPFAWLRSGLDIRDLQLHRGHLVRLPKLRPGDPDSPVLPNFDIRIDRLVVDNMRVDQGVLGPARRVDLAARADIRKGRLLLNLNGKFGQGDTVIVRLDSEPDRDKFDAVVDYDAKPAGMLADLSGVPGGMRVIIAGKGGWQRWDGVLLAKQQTADLGAFKVANRDGIFRVLGLARPQPVLSAQNARIAGAVVPVDARFSFKDRVLSGTLQTELALGKANIGGKADFGRNRLINVDVKTAIRRPELLLPGVTARNVQLALTLDGPFRDLAITHRLSADQLRQGANTIFGLRSQGPAQWRGGVLALPLDVRASRVVTGNPQFDPRLVDLHLTGPLRFGKGRVSSPRLTLAGQGLAANLTLDGDTRAGRYRLAGPVAANGIALANVGTVSGGAKIDALLGPGGWTLAADLTGRLVKVANATLADLAGGNIRFTGRVSLGSGRPILVDRARLTADKLALKLSGRRLADGRTTLKGSGDHADYGPFTFDAAIGKAGPQAVLVFASPLPAAQLTDVRVALSPIDQGFRIETSGGSLLGPFAGTVRLYSAPGRPARVEIEQMTVSETAVTGTVLLGQGGASGTLTLAGGGLDGTAQLLPQAGGQRVDVHLQANGARFSGDPPIFIANGTLDASGLIAKGQTTIDATLTARNVNRGMLTLETVAAKAHLVDGSGTVTAAVNGRRMNRFALVGEAQVAPNQISALLKGTYAGETVSMPRHAVLTRVAERDGGGWQLDPAQIIIGKAIAVAKGRLLGRQTDLTLGMLDLPIGALDPFIGGLNFGGNASGLIEYRALPRRAPTGTARLRIKGLTRSGLMFASRPLDVALAANLDQRQLGLRAVMNDGASSSGRVQALISNLPAAGDVMARLRAGTLFAQLRYNGPADALWRLTAIDTLDLTGAVAVAADVTGTLDQPQVRGSLASTGLRLRAPITGTDIQNINARGSFSGSRLVLPQFSGTTEGGGTVSGSGFVDLSDLATKGMALDLKLAARNAALLDRDDMEATVTGPLRIISDGPTGTIAGRVSIDRARWQLGRAASPAALPVIKTVEVNTPPGRVSRASVTTAWRYLIDASGSNRIDVRGLGLDSEWGARVRVRGSIDNPAVFGTADLVRGGYEFAGKRFELTRGNIDFTGDAPPDPQLDIVAEADVQGTNAQIRVGGTALRPEITFSSTPALPEEELLSRLLFGTSITNISAPEALQLGAALASLRDGGGMDPINRLRGAIGLDRLRVVSADATEGRGTSLAVGKYFGRRIYVEIVTDGKGYSATQAEFRVTRWLSILGAISSIGRESINARIGKDY